MINNLEWDLIFIPLAIGITSLFAILFLIFEHFRFKELNRDRLMKEGISYLLKYLKYINHYDNLRQENKKFYILVYEKTIIECFNSGDMNHIIKFTEFTEFYKRRTESACKCFGLPLEKTQYY